MCVGVEYATPTIVTSTCFHPHGERYVRTSTVSSQGRTWSRWSFSGSKSKRLPLAKKHKIERKVRVLVRQVWSVCYYQGSVRLLGPGTRTQAEDSERSEEEGLLEKWVWAGTLPSPFVVCQWWSNQWIVNWSDTMHFDVLIKKWQYQFHTMLGVQDGKTTP